LTTAKLERAYRKYQDAALRLPKGLSQKASAPLLLVPHQKWLRSKVKLLIVGQETLGWSFASETAVMSPSISTLQQFASAPGGMQSMFEAYKNFKFAQSYRHRNQAFWRAFRYLEQNIAAEPCAAMWTNLFKVDVGGSVMKNCTKKERSLLSEAQNGLLKIEITALKPNVVIFFTGPDYDEELYKAFPDLTLRGLWRGIASREMASAYSKSLPPCAIRTYHPSYLQRSRRWHFVRRLAGWAHDNGISANTKV
jgi:hypothetical protein